MDKPIFRNLVFEGGGVKGIAYLGALEELQQLGVLQRIIRVGGTSAGAIMAILLALGYSLDEVRTVLWDLDFRAFVDPSPRWVVNLCRILRRYGWCKGDAIECWLASLVRAKSFPPNLTFSQLREAQGPALYMIGTNLSTRLAEVFSAERTPDMSIVDAVRRSMSIPLYFASVRNARGDVFVDGGVFDNYPIKLFDRTGYLETGVPFQAQARTTEYYEPRNAKLPLGETESYIYNKQTLGFRLDTGREIAMFRRQVPPPRREIRTLFGYSQALVGSILNAQTNQHLHNDDWHRTIYIDTLGVGTTDFDLSEAKKLALVESGRSGAREYFGWYYRLEPGNVAINHPSFVDGSG
ncbi:patatin-like phospholipase family protein [Candidatus Bipolaricaulota bacterium]|nr:patatin-like phospholipase family protein [Candidatus Bipolaricaulota bacterium]